MPVCGEYFRKLRFALHGGVPGAGNAHARLLGLRYRRVGQCLDGL